MRADGACRGQVSKAQTVFFLIFGRTDLRIGVSGANFDAEIDFEVHFASAPQKPDEIAKNLSSRPILFANRFLFCGNMRC